MGSGSRPGKTRRIQQWNNPGPGSIRYLRKNRNRRSYFFGFTQDNTKRPQIQRKAFTDACIKSVQEIAKRDAEILVVGNTNSDIFPEELLEYTKRTRVGKGKIKINFLINYGWYWDLTYAYDNSPDGKK